MKSRILQEDHDALIKLNRSLSPEERLVAFYHHSQLLIQLSPVGRNHARHQTIRSSTEQPPLTQR